MSYPFSEALDASADVGLLLSEGLCADHLNSHEGPAFLKKKLGVMMVPTLGGCGDKMSCSPPLPSACRSCALGAAPGSPLWGGGRLPRAESMSALPALKIHFLILTICMSEERREFSWAPSLGIPEIHYIVFF